MYIDVATNEFAIDSKIHSVRCSPWATIQWTDEMVLLQGNVGIVAQPPQWLWDGMATFAPEVADLACEGVDVASAAAYFKVAATAAASVVILKRCLHEQLGTFGPRWPFYAAFASAWRLASPVHLPILNV